MSKLLLIIIVQLLFVPMLTLRTISMVKNLKVLTALFGFLEAVVYIFGLSIVLSGEQSILEMLVYAVGFAMGLIVGIIIEQKLAIGYVTYNATINSYNKDLIEQLRNEGFGVTVHTGHGKLGERYRLDILTQRKREKHLLETIYQLEPTAFIISYEPKMFKGGYLTTLMKKRMKKRQPVINASEDNLFVQAVHEVKEEYEVLKKQWKS